MNLFLGNERRVIDEGACLLSKTLRARSAAYWTGSSRIQSEGLSKFSSASASKTFVALVPNPITMAALRWSVEMQIARPIYPLAYGQQTSITEFDLFHPKGPQPFPFPPVIRLTESPGQLHKPLQFRRVSAQPLKPIPSIHHQNPSHYQAKTPNPHRSTTETDACSPISAPRDSRPAPRWKTCQVLA